MKFQFLLFVLYKKLTKAARKDLRFMDFVKSKRLKFTIKTSGDGKGRQYIFNNGHITSTAKLVERDDAAMVWCDPATAFKVMTSKNDEASVAALAEKKLQVEGNFKDFMWFSRALDIMMGKA